MDGITKINASHLSRIGYVYIRQSTSYQVSSNTESTLRQYALRDRLISLGWDQSLVHIIDSDLGISGKSTDNREGFTKLMADVAIGKVGAVACIEASRLSRCSGDWSRLIEICSMTDTLLIDTDGIYNPNDFNDRLLLGLKGTMSEAELHFLMERMRGGLLNKANRGELRFPLPVGYEFDYDDRIIKTSDIRVRSIVEQFFEVFRIKKAASAVVTYFAKNNMEFPIRPRIDGHIRDIAWGHLNGDRALAILRNPIYAGTYAYGKFQTKWVNGKKRQIAVPEGEWLVNIPNNHEAYITREEYEMNLSILRENSKRYGTPGKKTVPRNGAALLQGICFCGRCGYAMSPRYSTHSTTGQLTVRYGCDRLRYDGGKTDCGVSMSADAIDKAISKIVVEKLSPEVISLTVQVQQEVVKRERDHLRYYELQLENAKHEEEKARLRYMSVDPTNRLVALQLETEWNNKLRARESALERYNAESMRTSADSHEALMEAAKTVCENFSKVWFDPNTKYEDKKRILRYLIRDVTLLKTDVYTVKIGICFQGGATQEIEVELPKPVYIQEAPSREVLDFIDKNADRHTIAQLTLLLNENGFIRTCKRPFNRNSVQHIMRVYGIRNMKQRYIDKGWISMKDVAEKMGISYAAIKYRIQTKKYTGEYIQVDDAGTLFFNPKTIP